MAQFNADTDGRSAFWEENNKIAQLNLCLFWDNRKSNSVPSKGTKFQRRREKKLSRVRFPSSKHRNEWKCYFYLNITKKKKEEKKGKCTARKKMHLNDF